MKKIKVLIADDSALMRRAILKMLGTDDRFETPDIARDGLEALEMIKINHYNAVTLDIEMPRQNGIDTLKKIMTLDRPVPVIMFSSLTQKDATTTVQCLELGAIDCIGKPSQVLGSSMDAVKTDLIKKLTEAAIIPTVKLRQMAKAAGLLAQAPSISLKRHQIPADSTTKVILIGISTGGPQALQSFIPKLPKGFKVGIIIAQHMPVGFTKPMAERLNSHCQNEVKEAEDGDIIKPGRILIGKAGDHITFKKEGENYLVQLRRRPEKAYYPSIDVMFESAAQTFDEKVLAIVMTGMGNDGTIGAKELKKAKKNYMLAQDEASSTIFGMPKSIIDNNLADEVTSLDNMLDSIIKNL